MGSQNKFTFVAQAATLGNFFYLYKSKMNAGRHSDHFPSEPIGIECNALPICLGSKVSRIHL